MGERFFSLKNKEAIGILLFGFLLRFYDLGGRPLWRDEAFSALLVNNTFSTMFNGIINDVHPPLHSLILFLFGKLFGYSEFVLRFPSLLFGMLGLYFCFLIGKMIFNRFGNNLFLVLLAVNPLLIQYSQTARNYSMFFAFFVGALYFFLKMRESKEIKNYLLFFIFILLGLYTHNLFIIVFGLFLTYFILDFLYVKFKKIESSFNFKKILFFFYCLIILYLPWIFIYSTQFEHVQDSWWGKFSFYSGTKELFEGFIQGNFNFERSPILTGVYYLIFISFIYLFFLGSLHEIACFKQSIPHFSYFFFGTVFVFLIISLKIPIFYSRYLSFICPIFLIFIVKGWFFVAEFKRGGIYKIILLIFILAYVFLLVFNVIFYNNYQNVTYEITKILNYSNNQTLVLHNGPQTYFSFKYYSNFSSYIVGDIKDYPVTLGTSVLSEKDFIKPNLSNYNSIYYISLNYLPLSFSKNISKSGFKDTKEIALSDNTRLRKYERVS